MLRIRVEFSFKCLLTDEEYVPGPPAYVCAVRVADFDSIAETVAVMIGALRFLVVEINSINPELRQRANLAWFGCAVVICILPQSKIREDRVVAINVAVAVSSVARLVVLCQRNESIAM